MKSKLGLKIFLGTSTTLVLTFMIIFFSVYTLTPKLYEREFQNQFTQLVEEFSIKILDESSMEEIYDALDEFTSRNGINLQLTVQEGEYAMTGESNQFDAEQEGITIISSDLIDVYHEDLEVGFSLEAQTALTTVDQVTDIIGGMLPFIFGFSVLVSIILALFYSYYLARPIVNLSHMSRKMSEINLTNRCDIYRTDEIGTLADNLNNMAKKLESTLDNLQSANLQLRKEMEKERKQEKQRNDLFTAISHELKTPITILKGEIEGMIDQIGVYQDRDLYLQQAHKTTKRLEKLVYEILMISRMSAKEAEFILQKTDVTKLTQEACQKSEELADSRNVSITYYCEDNVRTIADEKMLQIAIFNIINNAIFHTEAGELVTVRLHASKDKGIITIENAGAHISEEDLENIFEPFYRVDKSRNRYTGGSGLGLFIVKCILDSHQFHYTIKNNEEGVIFTIEFLLVQ